MRQQRLHIIFWGEITEWSEIQFRPDYMTIRVSCEIPWVRLPESSFRVRLIGQLSVGGRCYLLFLLLLLLPLLVDCHVFGRVVIRAT